MQRGGQRLTIGDLIRDEEKGHDSLKKGTAKGDTNLHAAPRQAMNKHGTGPMSA